VEDLIRVPTAEDWIVLKQLHLTAEEWVRKWHETVNKEFERFPEGGYFVELNAPDLEHYSFSDELYLQAAKDGIAEKQETALRNLHLTENITRAFLDETLKSEKHAALRSNSPQIAVHRFKPRD